MSPTNEQLNTIIKVSRQTAKRYTFPGHTVEDMVQVGILKGLEGLSRYDANLPFENFIRTHIRNRLSNYKRDNYCRQEKVKDATKAERWASTNRSRQALMSPMEIDNVEHLLTQADTVADDTSYRELITQIRDELPVSLRTDFLRMLEGVKVPSNRRGRVQAAIADIIKYGSINEEN